ncbi:hypothetical protein [Soonwooa sp.]|uniref:hypothetical protein n=1 Tax=Soonwooa sp. TaxID=1938592 RepID=UPI0028A8750B|nr:hypothetical protein [Soonwooa sp.]
MSEELKIEFSGITAIKVFNGVWVAKCRTTKPLKSSVEMKGKSEAIAKKKLELFLKNEPYKHLDDLE